MGMQGIKDNSQRKYKVGGRRHNPVGLEQKRAEAAERAKAWRETPDEAKLVELDSRKKKGLGESKRQRARIEASMTTSKRASKAPQAAAPEVVPVVKKATKAKERRAQEKKG